MKKFLCVVIAFFIVVTLLSSCNERDVVNGDNTHQENSSLLDNYVEATTEPETKKVYTYKGYGLQNVEDSGTLTYDEQNNCYTSYLVEYTCPKCRNTVGEARANVVISSDDMGKDTIFWEGQACCTNTHDDPFFNGWFNVSIQYVLVEE